MSSKPVKFRSDVEGRVRVCGRDGGGIFEGGGDGGCRLLDIGRL